MIALSLKLNRLIFNLSWQKPKETAKTQTRSILRKSFKKHFPLIFFVVLNFSFISTEFDNLSFVCLILLAILTLKLLLKVSNQS